MPCLTSPAIFPNVHGNANGIASSIQISRMFVIGFGFSNGCDELALYGPPPFSPISLIASWLAIGPPGIVCVCPATVVTVLRRVEVLDRALAHEHEREHERERQQDARASCG